MRSRETRSGFCFWRATRGRVAVHIGLMMIAIIGMAALGTEIVFLLYKHRQMQAVADASALSGATALAFRFPADPAIEARAVAADSGFVDGAAQVTITVNHPPLSGPNAGNGKALEVLIAQPQTLAMVSLFTSPVYIVGVRAVAVVPSLGLYCMLALDPSASGALTIYNNAVATNPQCGAAVNSSSNTALILSNNAGINGPVSVHGNWSLAVNAHLTGTPLFNHAPPVPDPYAGVALQAIPACTGQVSSGGNGATIGLTAGHFCAGWNFANSATINLAPGTYYVDQRLTLANNFILNATGGVTLVINGTYAISLGNGGTVNITAPASGPYAGLAFFGPRNGTTAVTQVFPNNVILNIKGVVYFPSQTLEFDNNGATTPGGCTQVIGQIISVKNNIELDRDCLGTSVQPLGSPASYLAE
jgi:hypothetical protein